jgi:hypothetical protein
MRVNDSPRDATISAEGFEMSRYVPQLSAIARWIGGLLGAILIGAIGSGFWEVALRDPVLWLGKKLLEFVALIWGGYVDNLYSHLGSNYSDALSLLPFMLSVAAMVMFLSIVPLSLRREFRWAKKRWDIKAGRAPAEKRDLATIVAELDLASRRADKLFAILWAICPLGLAFTLFLTTQTLYVRGAANWIERSIEIEAPYLSPRDVLLMRSQFRSISDGKGFFALWDRIHAVARANSLQLPAFDPVGLRLRNP